jgi:hypothetical protein
MSCGSDSCRHDFQKQLSELNPAAADQLRRYSSTRGIATRGAWERALTAGTAADARKVGNGTSAEQVSTGRGRVRGGGAVE